MQLTHTNPITRAAAGALAALASVNASADCTSMQNGKIIAAEVQAFDYFASTVDIKGTRAIIGAEGDDDRGIFGGSAYIYELVGNTWTKRAKLLANDGVEGDRFSWSVAIDGNLAIVGAPFHDAAGEDAGAAYIYRNIAGVWAFETKLIAADTVAWDHFGYGVAISGDTVVVGAQLHDFIPADEEDPIIARAGAAYAFKRNANGTWTQQGTMMSSTPKADAFFGTNVAVEGDFAVIGAHNELNGGAAYVFKRTGSTWSQESRVVSGDADGGDRFGADVDISGDRIVVSATLDNTPQTPDGTLQVFKRNAANATWALEHRFWPAHPSLESQVGTSVSIEGDVILAGSWGDDGLAGAAYLFQRSGSQWMQSGRIAAADPSGGNDEFGKAVGLSTGRALIGAHNDDDAGGNAGAAYFFTISCTAPAQCAADVAPQPDGDNLVNVTDLLLVITTWGVAGGAGDVNNDGAVNVTDLLAVIIAWGACP